MAPRFVLLSALACVALDAALVAQTNAAASAPDGPSSAPTSRAADPTTAPMTDASARQMAVGVTKLFIFLLAYGVLATLVGKLLKLPPGSDSVAYGSPHRWKVWVLVVLMFVVGAGVCAIPIGDVGFGH